MRADNRRDHPRVCGEHTVPIALAVTSVGSSPRVRGTLRNEQGNVPRQGIIPACAGNTIAVLSIGVVLRDHPRVCGEHHAPGEHAGGAEGSSPRVRGTPQDAPPRSGRMGIIPACAGNTESNRTTSCSSQDHPRVCGEHSTPLPARSPCPGSSPRVRGTLHRPDDRIPDTGIIPACAGNTHRSG